MPDSIYDLRRRNLARLLAEPGAKQALALKLDMTPPPQISHWLRAPGKATSRRIHEDSARQIESALGLAAGSLDRDPDSARRPAPVDPLLTQAAVVVTAELQRQGKTLPLDRTAELTRVAYEHARDHGKVDEVFVQQIVKYGA